MRYRERLRIDATACRLIHAEGDLLPSIVVDRYADWLVVQTLSQAAERVLPDVRAALQELVRPAGILARNDSRIRALEGLEPRVEVLDGVLPESIVVREADAS